ncbi:predicted protein, partial [Nematostella vectensis]
CELNCLAKGHKFFLRLKPHVEDGTPCLSDLKKICIKGKCEVRRESDLKKICIKRRCEVRRVTDLKKICIKGGLLGYNPVITIPSGSTNINITEMRRSKNYLAIKSHESDKYFLNGNWVIDLPRGYRIAGTKFYYKRPKRNQKFNEAVISKGPINMNLDIMIIYQGDEPNIMYSYNLPPRFGGSPPKLAAYRWELAGYSECSHPCAGGLKSAFYQCIRSIDNVRVQDSLCTEIVAKPDRRKVCNIQPCPARWVPGEWKKCGKTCGSGIQLRNLYCRQKMDVDGRQVDRKVEINNCPQWSRLKVTRPCQLPPCPPPNEWKTGPWRQCSANCGQGKQTRIVFCTNEVRNVHQQVPIYNCRHSPQPESERNCTIKECAPEWFVTSWQKCSTTCGGGSQHRIVMCLNDQGKRVGGCEVSKKPLHWQRCNTQNCPRSRWRRPDKSEDSCKDESKGMCMIVVQARFCTIKSYRERCCESCKNL